MTSRAISARPRLYDEQQVHRGSTLPVFPLVGARAVQDCADLHGRPQRHPVELLIGECTRRGGFGKDGGGWRGVQWGLREGAGDGEGEEEKDCQGRGSKRRKRAGCKRAPSHHVNGVIRDTAYIPCFVMTPVVVGARRCGDRGEVLARYYPCHVVNPMLSSSMSFGIFIGSAEHFPHNDAPPQPPQPPLSPPSPPYRRRRHGLRSESPCVRGVPRQAAPGHGREPHRRRLRGTVGRGLHSFTFQLNVCAFCGKGLHPGV